MVVNQWLEEPQTTMFDSDQAEVASSSSSILLSRLRLRNGVYDMQQLRPCLEVRAFEVQVRGLGFWSFMGFECQNTGFECKS